MENNSKFEETYKKVSIEQAWALNYLKHNVVTVDGLILAETLLSDTTLNITKSRLLLDDIFSSIKKALEE